MSRRLERLGPRAARIGPRGVLLAGSWLVVGVVVLLLIRTSIQPMKIPPEPLPVAEGDSEVVWLFPATNAGGWRQLVGALADEAGDDLALDLSEAFPEETTSVPQVVVRGAAGAAGKRLVIRWYKLTSDWDTCDWTAALLTPGRAAPFAVIGGSNSNLGRELACGLRDSTAAARVADNDRPWLLITGATADQVDACPPGNPGLRAEGTEPGPAEKQDLNAIYLGRTRRFCFTNRQMADAVVRFLWEHPDLRPDREPIFAVSWEDDAYSRDLVDQFTHAIRERTTREMARRRGQLARDLVARPASSPWSALFPLWQAQVHGEEWREPNLIELPIDSSVGEFLVPNQFEERAVERLVAAAGETTPLTGLQLPGAPPSAGPPRQLLVAGGQTKPSRRFLRTLATSAPGLARRLVVATGDVLSFNTVYRDRRINWPIQQLPFPMIFFCHHNPVDRAAGFLPPPAPGEGGASEAARAPWAQARVNTGTEEVLLNREIARALLREWQGLPGGLEGEGPSPFGADGNRRPGTGEYVVCVRPRFEGPDRDRVLPEATVEVWKAGDDGEPWGLRESLLVHYWDVTPEAGDGE